MTFTVCSCRSFVLQMLVYMREAEIHYSSETPPRLLLRQRSRGQNTLRWEAEMYYSSKAPSHPLLHQHLLFRADYALGFSRMLLLRAVF